MILVGVEVGGDDDAVGKLPAGQRQLGLLAFRNAAELDEDLSGHGDIALLAFPGERQLQLDHAGVDGVG